MSGFTVIDLSDRSGHWTAVLNVDGIDYRASREHGSWQTERGGVRRDVLPRAAAALQDRVRHIERKRAKENDEAYRGLGGENVGPGDAT
jgi:hypothetical protein